MVKYSVCVSPVPYMLYVLPSFVFSRPMAKFTAAVPNNAAVSPRRVFQNKSLHLQKESLPPLCSMFVQSCYFLLSSRIRAAILPLGGDRRACLIRSARRIRCYVHAFSVLFFASVFGQCGDVLI